MHLLSHHLYAPPFHLFMKLVDLPRPKASIKRQAMELVLTKEVLDSPKEALDTAWEVLDITKEAIITMRSTQPSSSSSSSNSSGNTTPARRPTSLSGNLSLHELNNRLERYIQQIRLEPETNPTTITYERHTEGGSFDITSLPQYQEWESLQNEYLRQEEELAKVEAEIEMYKTNNKDLKDRNSSVEIQIREIEAR